MKNTRKIISVLLSILMIITSVPLMAVESFAATNGTTGDCTWTLDGTVLTISGNGKMEDYYKPWGKSITEVIIENGVTSIGRGVFSDCTSLEKINVGSDNANYSSENGILFNKAKTELIKYPAGKTEIEYIIPDSVTKIGYLVFCDCVWLTSITIPNSVTEICQEAFSKCTSLTNIIIPNSVTNVGYFVFKDCTSLTSVTIPNSITSIDNGAFIGCSLLTSVTIPASVTEIGIWAFGYYNEEKTIDGFTVYGNKGSEAERYANENGFKFAQAAPAPTMSFPDVTDGDWYYDAVKYNFERGYITGYSNGTFGPSNNIQRQDFVLILARIAGANLSAYEGQNGGFSDVQAGAYYASAVAWAKDKGVVTGYSADNFGVGTYITREQISLILCRYLNGSASGDVDAILNAYSDGGNTSPWAKAGVAWAVENGIIGNSDYLNPNGNAGRAEVAQIIYNMSNKGML